MSEQLGGGPGEVVLANGEVRVFANVEGVVRGLNDIEKRINSITKASQGRTLLPKFQNDLEKLQKDADAFKRALGNEKEGTKGFFSGLTQSIDNADDKLKEMGLSVRGVSVLLGAGLATGVAGIVRIGEQIAGMVSKVVSAERELQRQTEVTFRDGADSVREFAAAQSDVLGTGESKILETANAWGVYAIQIGLVGEEVDSFARGFASLADLASRAVPGVSDLESATKLIQSAIEGDIGAFRQLGFTTTEVNDIAQDRFGKTISQLGDLERAAIIASEGIDQIGEAVPQDKFIELGADIGEKIKDLGVASFGVLEQGAGLLAVSIGLIFVTLAQGVNTVLNGITKGLNLIIRGVNDIHPFADIPKIPELPTDQIEQFSIALGDLTTQEDGASAATDDLSKSYDKLSAAQKRIREEDFLGDTAKVNEALRARRDIIEAEADGVRRVQEAEEKLARVREDGVRKLRDVTTRNDRAIFDAHKRIVDAERDLDEAREDRQRKIRDAEEKLRDVRLQIFRDVRKAQEALDDFEREDARKFADLQEKRKKAINDASKAILHALLSVEEALLAGDASAERRARLALSEAKVEGRQSTIEAEKALAEFREDHALKLFRLKRDLHESELDGIKAIKEAERDLTEARIDADRRVEEAERKVVDARVAEFRAIQDATRALSDLEVEQNRALFDAKKGVIDAERERDRAIRTATERFNDLAASIGLTVQRLNELLNTLTGPALAPGPIMLPFQHGGPIAAGQLGLVGERGPELFIPNANGQIITNEVLRQLISALKSSNPAHVGSGHVSIQVNEAIDAHATTDAVMLRLGQAINN